MLAGIALLASLPRWGSEIEFVDLVRVESLRERWYLLMGFLGAIIGWRCVRAAIEPVPGRVQTAVSNAIMSLVILDAAVCFSVRGFFWAVMILCLLVPTMILEQWIRST